MAVVQSGVHIVEAVQSGRIITVHLGRGRGVRMYEAQARAFGLLADAKKREPAVNKKREPGLTKAG